MKNILIALFCVALLASAAAAQHQHHMAMPVSTTAKLEVGNDAGAEVLTLRLGPLDLPAHADHMTVAQPAPMILEIPFDGWIIAYHPRMVDGLGNPLPNRMLHHVAFWNTGRSDFLCPNKLEHIFGAGGEMNDWPAQPGIGYRVRPGDKIRITSMFHNPTDAGYSAAYLEVKVEYKTVAEARLASVYPAWLDVQACGESGYDLPPGVNVHTGSFTLAYSGKLLGVGGHLHDYGKGLTLTDDSSKDVIADLPPKTDAQGRLLSMPIKLFLDRGGYPLALGQVLTVSAQYENPTGQAIPEGAMGIVVGYFLPDDAAQMAKLKR
ncbi:MAG TPA: hypothetical protein VE825_12640 [Terriglobales bacterium]|jgi:hypothetical protein|nr:hypothetical protein [Terriglobales bacterium]